MTVPQSGDDDYRFPGFSAPNYTMVPDALFDELAPRLTEAELRVVLYIVRRTFGFKKTVDSISFSQFLTGITTQDGRVLDVGCGVRSRGHLSRALKHLAAMGVIVALKAQNADGGNAVSTYALRMATGEGEGAGPQGGGSSPTEPGGVVPQRNQGSSRSEPGVVPQRNPQETVRQKTVGQDSFEASKAPQSTLFVDNSGDTVAPTPENPVLASKKGGGEGQRGQTRSTKAPTSVALDDESSGAAGYRRKRAELPPQVMIPLTRLMEDLSRDLNDGEHVASNISRAANLYAAHATDVDGFFVAAYEARTFARQQVNARSRMALFFAALERTLAQPSPV